MAESLREKLAALGLPLPWRLSEEDPGVVLDADGWDAFTVDVNRQMTDASATSLAGAIVAALNAAGGESNG